MSQKRYEYLEPNQWKATEAALHMLLPNYSLGEITGVMCDYGFTSDWRKSLKTFRIEAYRGDARYKDMLLESKEFREASLEEALQAYNRNGRFDKVSFPRLSKEETAAGVLLYDWYSRSAPPKEDPSALLCGGEDKPSVYLKVWPL